MDSLLCLFLLASILAVYSRSKISQSGIYTTRIKSRAQISISYKQMGIKSLCIVKRIKQNGMEPTAVQRNQPFQLGAWTTIALSLEQLHINDHPPSNATNKAKRKAIIYITRKQPHQKVISRMTHILRNINIKTCTKKYRKVIIDLISHQ